MRGQSLVGVPADTQNIDIPILLGWTQSNISVLVTSRKFLRLFVTIKRIVKDA